MENVILYSSAGLSELMVAVPEPKAGLLGSYSWQWKETPGIRVENAGSFPAPNPTASFDHVTLYKLSLTTQAAVQEFNMVQPITPMGPLVQGRASMIAHPVSTTYFVHATLPVGGVDKTPLCIAVPENSGSTGYAWRIQDKSGSGLQIATQTYSPQTSMVGTPGTQVFFCTATEPGANTFRLELIGPSGGAPVSQVVVAFTATK
ncbi:MAG TPA: protease inhibitor I42 family protein [Symbiobacteriaceae bacterium]|nr:protease inhibitor I42 family protein [Symbiobacteriaceae bacterium]